MHIHSRFCPTYIFCLLISSQFSSSPRKVPPLKHSHRYGITVSPLSPTHSPPPTTMQEFHAFSVSPNKEHKLTIPEGCGFHLSVLSLPRGTNGKSTVYVSADGKSYALASLNSQQNILQAPTDLIFNYQQQVTFFAKGSATVHCVGYRQELDLDDDNNASFAMEDSGEDNASNAAKTMALPVDAITDTERGKKRAAAAATAATVSGDEEEEGEEVEDEDRTDSAEDASADETSDAEAAGEEMEEEEEDDDEEIDSDIAEEPKRGMQARRVDPTAPSSEDDEENGSDGDDEEGDAMEESEGNDDDEEEEEEEAEPPMKALRSEGRPSGGSPQGRLNGNSPQGRPSNGSPHGRHSAGGTPQGRKSGGGLSQGSPSTGGSPKGLKNGGASQQGRRSF
ncbi:hypothetical protein CUR178_06642 [Leishmania enriettii]|uniref:Nucleoplasmin-like domain-containing protein n=1 Tax=Leishmania enriettii TaxID=5663 RepID=A0A836H3R2_LEIEN|nr:hypothetical protein CUR178_06642 [Leishmania enriettii]